MNLIDLGIIRGKDGERYSHVIDTDTDSTHVLDGKRCCVLTVDYSANVFDAQHVKIGYFYMTADDAWVYIDELSRDVTVTGFNDLLKAERYVFANML